MWRRRGISARPSGWADWCSHSWDGRDGGRLAQRDRHLRLRKRDGDLARGPQFRTRALHDVAIRRGGRRHVTTLSSIAEWATGLARSVRCAVGTRVKAPVSTCYTEPMALSARATYRRTHWVGGVAGSHAEADEMDVEFWANATPGERVRGVTQLIDEMRTSKEHDGSPDRLQRTVGGVRARRG